MPPRHTFRKMSDDERDQDIESDADKRAHHNALERQRRDRLKDSYSMLSDALPYFKGDKVRKKGSVDKKMKPGKTSTKASRALVLKRSVHYIESKKRKIASYQQDIDCLREQNETLEKYVQSLQRAKQAGNYADANEIIEHIFANNKVNPLARFHEDSESDDSSDSDDGSDSDDSFDSYKSKDNPRKRRKSNARVPVHT